MSTIQTASGVLFDLAMPRAAQVNCYDIATALAQLPRFTGHCLRHYSVAEHSLLVCDIAEFELELDVQGQFSALMHDAHEAYCGDLSTPAKTMLGDAWYAFERRLERAVQQAYQLDRRLGTVAAIKQADLTALATERRDLLLPNAQVWPCLRGIEPVAGLHLLAPERAELDWEIWRDRFLDRFHRLQEVNQATATAGAAQPA